MIAFCLSVVFHGLTTGFVKGGSFPGGRINGFPSLTVQGIMCKLWRNSIYAKMRVYIFIELECSCSSLKWSDKIGKSIFNGNEKSNQPMS